MPTVTWVTGTAWDEGIGDTCATITFYTTGSAVTNDSVWNHWINATVVTSATTTASAVWTIWNDRLAAAGANAYPMVHHAQTRMRDAAIARGRVSPEERARRDAAERARVAANEIAAAARVEANRKAEVLLRSCLSQQQIDDLEKKNCFYLHTNGRRYRIDRGQHGNVKLLDERDQIVESYCIQPRGGLPDADAMLAQKLLLETDPDSFRRISNITTRAGWMRGADAPLLEMPRFPPLPDMPVPALPRIAL